MTIVEARLLIVEGINYAAYKETDTSVYDADKNCLLGFEHYKSGRHILKTSPWAEGDFEEKMATLLGISGALNRSDPAFTHAVNEIEGEDSVLGRVIRRSRTPGRQ
jgi:hypothetical protein